MEVKLSPSDMRRRADGPPVTCCQIMKFARKYVQCSSRSVSFIARMISRIRPKRPLVHATSQPTGDAAGDTGSTGGSTPCGREHG